MKRMLILLALLSAVCLAGFAPSAHAEDAARQALRDAGMNGVVGFAGEYGAQVEFRPVMPQIQRHRSNAREEKD